MKLNLGAGNKKVEGFIGVDIKAADVVADIRELPFADDSADEIMAIHVAEHIPVHEIVPVIREWLRVLKPGGKMALELPCLDKVLWHFRNGGPENMTLWALYGDPRTHVDGFPAYHKWAWSLEQFRKMLKHAGAKDVTEETPHYHQPSRDMRFVCTK